MGFVRRAFATLRDVWLMIGVVVLLCLSLEIAYRAQGALRGALRGALTSGENSLHPLYGEAWFAEYLEDEPASERLRWKPFVYYRRAPFDGQVIHIDSAGRRLTRQAVRVDGDGAARTVWMFGGSTMWGNYQRESATIPAVVAQRLAASGMPDVAVTNFGETGYVLSQETVELLFQLRDGVRPDVVVFYDGINDIVALVQNGRAGLPQNESNRVRDFQVGRALFSWRHDLRTEAGAAATLAGLSTARSQLVRRLQQAVAPEWKSEPASTLVDELLASYVSTVRLIESLAAAYDFDAIYLWQPSLHGTRKPLSKFEQALMDRIDADPFESALKTVHLAASASIDSAMTGVAPGRFLNLTGVLAADTGTIFLDAIGHTVERANGPIVDAFLPVLLEVLAGRARRPIMPGTPMRRPYLVPALDSRRGPA